MTRTDLPFATHAQAARFAPLLTRRASAYPGLTCVTAIPYSPTGVYGIVTVGWRPLPGAMVWDSLAPVALIDSLDESRPADPADLCEFVVNVFTDVSGVVHGVACMVTTRQVAPPPVPRIMAVALGGGWTDEAADVREVLAQHRAAVSATW